MTRSAVDASAPVVGSAVVRRRPRLGRSVLLLLLAFAAAAALLGAVRASGEAPARPEDRVRSVASGLRCPSCAGQSVADSESEVARQMRAVVADRLGAGWSPEQIRAWFVTRYGSAVLLDPTGSSPGVAALPVGVPAVVLLVVALVGWRRGARTVGLVTAAGAVVLAGVAVALLARSQPTTAPAWAPAAPAAVAAPLAAAAAPAPPPTTPATGTETSAAAVRTAARALENGDASLAAETAGRAVAAAVPGSGTHADALLVLGLAQRELGRDGWRATLRRFLQESPTHAAAPRVRTLLSAS